MFIAGGFDYKVIHPLRDSCPLKIWKLFQLLEYLVIKEKYCKLTCKLIYLFHYVLPTHVDG